MAYKNIHAALTQSLIDLALGVPVAYENTAFDPDKDGGDLFVAVNTIPADQESLSKQTLDEVRGVYQISIYSKSNVGAGASLAIVDTITDNYKHNDSLIYSDQIVTIINCAVNTPRNDSGWYVTDVSILFKTDIPR